MANLKFAERQFHIFSLNAMRAHAEIVSGAYKHRKVMRGPISKPDEQTLLTEEELLIDKVEEMKRHINLAREQSEWLYEQGE